MPLLTDADEHLRAWLAVVVGDVPVRAGPPRDVVADEVVEPELTAYLFELASGLRVNGDAHRPPPTVVRLGYLICADAPEPQQALQVLEAVLVAALEARPDDMGDFEVDLAPLPSEEWTALGVRPRPAVRLRLTAHHQRRVDQGSVVRTPLQLVGTGSQRLAGRVIGPGDQPLAGAEVAVEAIAATTRTSDDGTFSFPMVPTGAVRLAVRAKGRSFAVDADPEGEPLVIHCDPSEA